MSKILDELAAATDIERKAAESDERYIKALGRAVNRLSDEKWSDLSDAAQAYANDVIEAIKEKKAAPMPPDADDVTADEPATALDPVSDDAADDDASPAEADDDAADDADDDVTSADVDGGIVDDVSDTEEAPATAPAAKPKARKSSRPSAVAAAAPKRRNDEMTATRRMYDIMLEHGLDIPASKVLEIASGEGFKCSEHSARLRTYAFRKACEVLDEHGFFSGKKPKGLRS